MSRIFSGPPELRNRHRIVRATGQGGAVMGVDRARPLRRCYALGVAGTGAVFLVLVAGLAVAHFKAERAARLESLARDLAALRLTLDALVKPAADHVERLRRAAEDHLAGRAATPTSPLRALLRPEVWRTDGEAGEGLFLDKVAGTPAEHLVGNLYGRADLLTGREQDPLELDTALGLFEPMRLSHLGAPYLRWSYYFSGRGGFVTVYPYAPGQTLMRQQGGRSIEDFLAKTYTYEAYRLGLPAANPGRRSYWTAAYFDTAAAGWMVSHAAPVYAHDVFVGVVGTDVLLEFLSTFLARQHRPPGRAWIVDGQGRLLADSAEPAPAGDNRPAALADKLPETLAARPLTELLDPSGSPRRIGGWEVTSLPLAAAPWHLVLVASEREVTSLVLARFWPYAALLSGVLATLLLAQLLLQRFFIGPAMALVERVEEQGRGEPENARPAPRLWQPWFAAVDGVFGAARRHLARVREEQALKAAMVEASFDSIITVDEAGRVLEFNKGAERTFGHSRADALDRPIGGLIVPPHLRDQHTRGMQRYLATGEQRVLGRRVELDGMRADGSLFPLELAIAEVPLDGRRLFTAYLRDITDRRRAEQALQASERRLRAVVEDQTEMICRYGPDFRLTFSNQAHARMFGLAPEQLLGRNLIASIPAELREPLREQLLALTPQAPICTSESQKVLADGEVHWFAWTNRALFDEAGRLVGYQTIGRDVTSQKRAERALEESAAELALVTSSIPLAVAVACVDRPEILFANREAVQALGLRPGKLLERAGADAPGVADHQQLLELLARTSTVEGLELRMHRADGTDMWALVSARPIPFRGTTAVLTVITDITARRQMEESLRATEARFLAAAESIPDGLVILDPDDRIVFFNHRHPELLPPALRQGLRTGIRFEDWIREGLTRGAVYHPDMGQDYAARRLTTRREERTEREHRHADGRWVRVREGRMPDDGRVLLTTDVTARREAEEALRRSETRYRAVVEGQTEFILRLRPNGTLTFLNDAYCRHRGLPREVLLGSDDIGHYPAAQQDRVRLAWAGLSPERPTITYELEEPSGDRLRHEEWTDTGIFDGRGRLVEVQAVGRDVTERKHAEAEVRRQREALHQQEKLTSLGSLLAGVAHELNNPLSVVVGRALMLEEEVQDPATRTSLVRLRAAAERCARIVKSFLSLARQKPHEPRPVDAAAVLDAVVEILAYGLRSAGIEVQREGAGKLPPVVADEDQLHQVFLNLVVNAQQALEGVPSPRQLWLRTAAEDGVIRVEVADNGPGVPAQLRGRIFDPFFTTKPVGSGTGLGLSVCHGIVVAHGGTVTVDERPGGGACFAVTLPASPGSLVPTEAPSVAAEGGAGGRVLVVDDEPEVVSLLEEALARDGHEVTTASDGAAALDLLRTGQFDAVLCDLRMPRLDGSGLARALEAARPDLAARLLMMTGDTLRAASSLPADARDRLLEKPLDPEEVRRRVRELVAGGC